MHGRIWFESELGRGSCFYFSALFATAETIGPNPAAAAPLVTDKFCHALVVDDEEYNRVVLVDLLQNVGFTVQAAGTGAEALDLAERHDFHLVSLDYDLPRMNGPEVARKIRQLSNQTARALIIATTAFNSPEKRAQCLAAGMNDFLGKPVTTDRLREILASAHSGGTTGPAAPPDPAPEPADCLDNLRHLAAKKQRAFADELALFLAELDTEMNQLTAALEERNPGRAGHLAHLLCGRFGFLHQRELVRILQKIESAAGVAEWTEADAGHRALSVQLGALRVRLASSVPVAQPA
jgi:CheY-like chemotaxis protein